MSTNYEAIVSLVGLLVKKAGFDLSKDYSEAELQKTKDMISELIKEKNNSNNKKVLSSVIDNLKVRQANWENNAEIVGKSIIKAYEDGKDYNSVKMRIELLCNLASKGTNDITVGSVYDKLKELESSYEELQSTIASSDYRNEEEKEMDVKYKVYLENKIESLTQEIDTMDKEIESLREIEIKDVNIVLKLKDYVGKLKKDLDKVNSMLSSSINSDIAFDVWERLETAKNETDEKYDKSNELLKKTEGMLDEVKKNIDTISERKKRLEDEKNRCSNKLNNVSIKLEEDIYDNKAKRIIDENNSEVMRLELEALRNKKDVIYVDANKVKEELIKEWSKERVIVKNDPSKEDVKEEIEETVTPKENKEVIEEKTVVLNENKEETVSKKEDVTEKIVVEKKNKIELDW